MAVDSRDKRQSALNYSRFNTLSLPTADGSVDADDRQQLWGLYSGILVDAPVAVVAGPFCTVATGKWTAGALTHGTWNSGYVTEDNWTAGHLTSDISCN